MKILRLTTDGLPHFDGRLDINLVATQRVSETDRDTLTSISPRIYLSRVISFIGINASGKTTILKALTFITRMLNNEPINTINSRHIFDDVAINDTVRITSYLYDNNNVYKLITDIGKSYNPADDTERLIISDEKLFQKSISKVRSKNALFDFTDKDSIIRRNHSEQYLMDDVSIIIAENKKASSRLDIIDMMDWTDYNKLNVLGRFPKELLTFLDPSIEYLECKFNDKKFDIRLKFFEQDEIVLTDPKILENYLSSGTIKGLGVFMNAVFTFLSGGYLIIDEIENHFNHEIVSTLIRFYMDSSINKTGATLIMSTHYSELLDLFNRNDGIYIVRNSAGISVENLSEILHRNDIKKSEVYDSDYLHGTVPVYESYLQLARVLKGVKSV